MEASPKICNLLIWGENSYAIDLLVCRLMGFDDEKVHFLSMAPSLKDFPISSFTKDELMIRSNLFNDSRKLPLIRDDIAWNFIPAGGWKGHIELENE